MAEKDYISPPVVIKKTLVFNQKDLYRHLKKSFKDHGYSIKESSYDEGLTDDGSKKISFSWEASKKASVYVKLTVMLHFISVAKDVMVKEDDREVSAQKGTVELKFMSFIKKDPESEWEFRPKKPFAAFTRELYDKVVKRDDWDKLGKSLEADVAAVMDDAKLFLKMRRYD